MEKKTEMDYKKMSVSKMFTWLNDNEKSKAELYDFAEKATSKKDGKLVENLNSAKKYFYEKYKDEIIFTNPPKAKAKKMSTLDKLAQILKEGK